MFYLWKRIFPSFNIASSFYIQKSSVLRIQSSTLITVDFYGIHGKFGSIFIYQGSNIAHNKNYIQRTWKNIYVKYVKCSNSLRYLNRWNNFLLRFHLLVIMRPKFQKVSEKTFKYFRELVYVLCNSRCDSSFEFRQRKKQGVLLVPLSMKISHGKELRKT